MSTHEPQPPEMLRDEARRLYGKDPVAYDAGRPDYPELVYEVLSTRCGLEAGTSVLEIGPGTGRVTGRLLVAGAHVVGVEPDETLAGHLSQTMGGPALEVVPASFEDARLDDDGFDLAVAAMSFHWIDQRVGLTKLARVLRPGGSVAIWWTVFGDPSRPDPLLDTIGALLPEGAGPRRQVDPPQFELDMKARKLDLENLGGFVDVHGELIRWSARMSASQIRALYASMIAILRLPRSEQEDLLDAIESVATEDFGGRVERPFVTALYTGRRREP